MITITLNGERRETRAGTIAALLEEIGISGGRVAVELNHQVIRRAEHAGALIKDGDLVEVVNFVGGG